MEIQGQQGYELEFSSPIMYFAFPLTFSLVYLSDFPQSQPLLTKDLGWIFKISLVQEKCKSLSEFPRGLSELTCGADGC